MKREDIQERRLYTTPDGQEFDSYSEACLHVADANFKGCLTYVIDKHLDLSQEVRQEVISFIIEHRQKLEYIFGGDYEGAVEE